MSRFLNYEGLGGGQLPPIAQVLSLNALTLSAVAVIENSSAGTPIGAFLGTTPGSTLALSDNAGGRFAISAGSNLVAGLVATDYETATSHNITVVETLAGAANSPRYTTLTITVVNVFEKPNLSALSFSASSFTLGTAASGAIVGATPGSTITSSGLPAGITINSAARTWAYDGSGTAGSSSITLTETLGDSANSPRQSAVSVTIAAAAPAPTGTLVADVPFQMMPVTAPQGTTLFNVSFA